MSLHRFLDFEYGADGDQELRRRLVGGEDPNQTAGAFAETPLHVAARRYRTQAVVILLEFGADIEARTKGGKTAYAHCVRRGFNDLAERLQAAGANTDLQAADRLAVAMVGGRLDEARRLLAENPDLVCTGNPEEDRLLADLAGRQEEQPVALLIQAGANLSAAGLDDGTPLHQAAWFGQPANARQLIAAGAPLEIFDATHQATPLGWVAHGSRYSGDAENRQDAYVELAEMLLQAGAQTGGADPLNGGPYLTRLLREASPRVSAYIQRHLSK